MASPLPGRLVTVVVDNFGRLGGLTYAVPAHLTVGIGDAVKVPFGQREAVGVVVAAADSTGGHNIKDVIEVYGRRTSENDLQAARSVAAGNLSDIQWMVNKLAPNKHKGAQPGDYGQLKVKDSLPSLLFPDDKLNSSKLMLLRPPGCAPEVMAAQLCRQIAASGGQILVLCPSAVDVTKVYNLCTAGAVRLDAKAADDAWASFRAGTAQVGIGTHAAAWYAAKNLSHIVVVEEESEGHRTNTTPRAHSRDVAVARAAAHHAQLILITANPSVRALGVDGIAVSQLDNASSLWPDIQIRHADSQTSGIPDDLYLHVESQLKLGRKVSAVMGTATMLCARCFTPTAGEYCPMCGYNRTVKAGFDEARIAGVFGDQVEPLTLAKLATRRDYGTIIVPELDATLSMPSLQPYHHTAGLLMAAATAAGPSGSVWATTRSTPHPSLTLIANSHDQLALAHAYYKDAKRLALPPFGRLVTVSVSGENPPEIHLPPSIIMHGPKQAKNGWEYIFRLESTKMPQLNSTLARLRRKGRKVSLVVA